MRNRRLEFFINLDKQDRETRFALFLRYRLVPVTAGVKPAELVTFCPGRYELFTSWKQWGSREISLMGLEVEILRERENCCCAFIYNREELKHRLSNHDEATLLSDYGYPECTDLQHLTIENHIAHLRSRFIHSCPHEIGLFLGIPPHDVCGFITNEGSHFLLQGYWKVYAEPDQAIKTFNTYDEVKDTFIRELVL